MIYNELKRHGTEDFPFELYRVSKLHPKYEMAFHWHSHLEIIRVLKGELALTVDNRLHELKAGEVAFLNSESVHGATPKECEYECLVFSLGFLKTGNASCDEFIDNLLAHEKVLYERPRDSVIVALVHKIFDAMERPSTGANFQVMGRIYELLGEILIKGEYTSQLPSLGYRDEKKAVKLKTVLKYIREQFSRNITLDEIANVSGFSCKYFCKFFKEMTGSTPVNYLVTYRIERSARMLLSTDLSVTQIAEACGFNDLSYFIKTFKKFYQLSPTDYRKREE